VCAEANSKDDSTKDGAAEANTDYVMPEADLKNAVDMILEENDLNKDGFITYAEFVVNQRAAINNS